MLREIGSAPGSALEGALPGDAESTFRDLPLQHRCDQLFLVRLGPLSGSEKGVFWKRCLFRKVHYLEILANLKILEILDKPQTVENNEESSHFLEILENFEISEILEIEIFLQ